MPRLSIDGREVTVPAGATVLDAARAAGIEVPTLCHLEGSEPFTSCMLCTVRDQGSGRSLPSCSVQAMEGMDIDASGPLVREERRSVLDLLLSEHVGNCEGPCRQGCPADMDIPGMITLIEIGDLSGAAMLARDALVLPRTLAWICPAPCEMTCRRGLQDEPIGIRGLVGYAMDAAGEALRPPACGADTGHRVAIVGAGPAGLAAAWYLRRWGHGCTVFDAHDQPGGMVRYGLPDGRLPIELLDRDLAPVLDIGIHWQFGVKVGEDIAMETLKADFAAVILAVGKVRPELPARYGVEGKRNGIEAAEVTHQTSDPRVFAGGDAVRATRRTVHSVADGRRMAQAVDALLHERPPPRKKRRFNSTIGCPQKDEMPVLAREADPGPRVRPAGGAGGGASGYDAAEAVRESKRCLHCECRKADDCRLRDFADAYDARGDRFPGRIRAPVERDADHPRVLFEPGKCIKCSICLRVAEREGAPLGLTFLERGYDVRVGTPFRASLQQALGAAAEACVVACPTAALAFQRLESQPEPSSPKHQEAHACNPNHAK